MKNNPFFLRGPFFLRIFIQKIFKIGVYKKTDIVKKMGGNAPLMAGIIVFQTIASIGTMAFMIAR